MKLYAGPHSGNSYKVRILLALLGIEHALVIVSLAQKHHKSEAFKKLNPRGQVPVLEDEGHIFWDSGACLYYLAEKYGGSDWLPQGALARAEIVQWMALAAAELQFGLQYARRGVVRGRWIAGDLEQLQAIGVLGLAPLETRLAGHDWLCGDRPTIADIACFPYVESAPEALIDLAPYPGITAWLHRCRALPGWPTRVIDPAITTQFDPTA